MRLVDIAEFYSEFGGGVRTYVHQKLEASAKCGVETTIIAPGPADRRERRAGGEILWVRSPVLALDHRYHIFADMRPVHALLDDISPDVIEGSSTWQGARIARAWKGKAARALFLHQDPVAVYPHSIFSPRLSEHCVDQLCFWFWAYLRDLARGFDATVAPGRHFAARLRRFAVPNVEACPLGVDKPIFSHEFRDETLRRSMLAACGAKTDAVLFIAVSRHHPEKRLLLLIEAFDRFRRARPAALYIVGDGPMWRAVGARAAATPNVHVAGPIGGRSDLARHLASADYFLHGGAAETFGLVVGEALCSGLPVIVPDRGGAAELAHPAYAETYRSGDAAALAAAMARMTGRDRNDLSLAARAGGCRLSTPAEHFDQLFALYASLGRAPAERRAA